MPVLYKRVITKHKDFVTRTKCFYYNPLASKKSRGIRLCKAGETKSERNKRNSYLKRKYEMFENFDVGDYFITLTYREWLDAEAAHKCMTTVFSKIRKALKRKNIPFVYYGKTEAGNTIRPHHHALIRNASPEIIGLLLKYWKEFGNVKDVKEIYNIEDGRLISYILDGGDHKGLTFEKYSHSRNLKQPIIEKRIYPTNSFRENPRPPKPRDGYRYEIVPGSLYNGFPDIDGFTYQEYELRKIVIQE